jgi:energy-coupling factor transport system permease protein
MLKDITLGQFFPGNSWLHRADPRAKILLTILYIAAIFTAKNIISFAVLFLATVLLIVMSRISPIVILKAIKPLIFILIFTAVLNLLWTDGENVLVSFWKITIYEESVWTATLMALRIVILIVGTCVLLTYTTSPIMLTEGLERLLSPLKAIKLPVHEFAMMMTIALRFIPTLIEETDKIMSAQKSRGADFSSGGLVKRAKALVPILIPLFVSAFRRADDLAIAMECRCYRGDSGRTRMTELKFSLCDLWVFLFLLAVLALVILFNILSIGYSL